MQILSGIKYHIFLSMVWKFRQHPCCCVYQKVSNRILPMLSDTEFVPNCHGVITLDPNIIHLEELADEKQVFQLGVGLNDPCGPIPAQAIL